MRYSKEERETIVLTDESLDHWEIYTTSRPHMNRLSKIVAPYQVDQDKEGVYAMRFRLPKSQVSFRKPKVLSEAHRAKLSAARKKRSEG
jgi:hypothetical protein